MIIDCSLMKLIAIFDFLKSNNEIRNIPKTMVQRKNNSGKIKKVDPSKEVELYFFSP